MGVGRGEEEGERREEGGRDGWSLRTKAQGLHLGGQTSRHPAEAV